MKLVLLSDTHMGHEDVVVPSGDILVHSGDATFKGSIKEVSAFGKWFSSLPHKYKIFVAGNHDWLFEKQPALAKSLLPNIIYLEDSFVEIEGLRIWGSPVQPWFCDWAFNKIRGAEIKRHWDMIPENLDLLVTHGPPYGILDECPGDGHVGCADLLNAVYRVKPKIHLFGHIHEGSGIVIKDGITFVNGSIMDGMYNVMHQPRVIEL